jgi:hypothetical protein
MTPLRSVQRTRVAHGLSDYRTPQSARRVFDFRELWHSSIRCG